MFLMSVMVCPFIFTACEKDEGTTGYNDVNDDDWKKAVVIENECDNADTQATYYVNE